MPSSETNLTSTAADIITGPATIKHVWLLGSPGRGIQNLRVGSIVFDQRGEANLEEVLTLQDWILANGETLTAAGSGRLLATWTT